MTRNCCGRYYVALMLKMVFAEEFHSHDYELLWSRLWCVDVEDNV